MAGTNINHAVAVRGLRKSYGGTPVLDGIDLTVDEGSVFALLGPNGAGKTTLVNVLSTLVGFDDGDASVAGFDVRSEPGGVRASIGVTGQFSAIDHLLTGEENLMLMADLHHLEKADARRRVGELLERFDLTAAATALPSTYSGGMQRRLDLAMGLVGSPSVVFLDEPTTGLDPRGRQTVWEGIRDLASAKVTIFLTTQYLEEADRLADRIALLDEGRIVAEGTPSELKRLVPGGHVSLRFPDEATLAAAAAVIGGERRTDELALDVAGDGGVGSIRRLLDELDRESVQVDSLTVHTPDLDDVFFALTGRSEREVITP